MAIGHFVSRIPVGRSMLVLVGHFPIDPRDEARGLLGEVVEPLEKGKEARDRAFGLIQRVFWLRGRSL